MQQKFGRWILAVAFIALVASRMSPAAEGPTSQHLVTLTNDVGAIFPEVAVSVKINGEGHLQALTYVFAGSTRSHSISYQDLTQPEGASIRGILTFKTREFSASGGGKITVLYPYNFVTQEIRPYEMELIRVNDTWTLLDGGDRQPTQNLFMKKNDFYGQPVGVMSITPVRQNPENSR